MEMPVKFDSLFIKTDVTAIKIIKDIILTATGSYLYIFGKHDYKYKNKIKLFEGQSCYGIEPNSAFNELLCYGANKLKMFKFDSALTIFRDFREYSGIDWILTAQWMTNDNFAVLTMHNVAILYTSSFEKITRFICEERCLLYSGFICKDPFVILSGTVFSEVLVWKPVVSNKSSYPVTHRLKGHKGVIFSIDCIPASGLICSTSDDRTAKLWKLTTIFHSQEKTNEQPQLLCTVNGHTSRIFRCQIFNNNFATAGEDSIVNLWNFKGNLLKKITATKGDSIWALDYDENDRLLVVGNGDGSVVAVKLNSELNVQTFDSLCSEKLKRLAILYSGNIVSITEEGSLYYFLLQQYKLELIARHLELKSYALLEVSRCRKLFALASFRGTIFVYEERKNGITLKYYFETGTNDRIFSLHWLTCKMLLTCEKDGDLKMWSLRKKHVNYVTTFILPHSKERWSTAACLAGSNNVIVGDRKGNIHVFIIGEKQAVQTIKKAHNHLGITHLTTQGQTSFSLGRNGVLKVYTFEQKLVEKTSDKLPFAWLSKLVQYEGKHFLLGFSGQEFLVWDCADRRYILQHSCGGGHRSWDFYKIGNSVIFTYLKEQSINIVTTDWLTFCPRNVVKGLHSSEINALTVLPIISNKHQHIIVSGGEDTTFQLSTLNLLSENINELFDIRETLKSHLSSIRTIVACGIHKNITNNDTNIRHYLISSAGGRAQIVLWLLTVEVKNEEIKNINCYEKCSYYESLTSDESEMRIMDLTTIKSGNTITLFAACSDGKIKVFTTYIEEMSNLQLSLAHVLLHTPRCILKICSFAVCGRTVLATMNTEGKIMFWDVVNVSRNLKPFFEIVAHQSGINSYSYIVTNNKCFFLTGGDDNAVVLHVFQFVRCNSNSDVIVKGKYVNVSSHCAQVTGAFLTENYFVTTSVDQRVLVYRWDYYDSEICVEILGQYNSSIADIQGMQILKNSSHDVVLHVILYGKGIEIIKISLQQ